MASDEQTKQTQGEPAKSASGTPKSDATQNKQATGQTGGSNEATEAKTTDAITLLKTDHREVEKLFAEYEKATNRSRKAALIEQVAVMLKIHAELEESIFYPAVRKQAEADDKLDEAQVEHDTLKILIADLEGGSNSEFRDAKVKVLAEYVKHHVQEEEAGDGILEQGRKGGLDLNDLGQQMAQLKAELQQDPSQLRAEPVSIQGFGQTRQLGRSASAMAARGGRGSQDRDEQGRFAGARGGRDDGGRSQPGRAYEDDYRGASSRSGGSFGREERGRGSDEGRGGWFGDPRGHSEAARRGWDDRERSGSARPSGRFDDDDRRGGSGRRGSQAQGQGWHGDPQGHSEAARRGRQHRDDDGRGDFGARMSDDDDRRYGRNLRGDDEDRGGRGQSRGGGRGESRGGWFGDPRGHSEAARRGWDDRR